MKKPLLACCSAIIVLAGSTGVSFALPKCEGSPTSYRSIWGKWNYCEGTITSAKNNKFIGEFKKGRPDGQGTFISANGEKYIGKFMDGKRHGQGTYTFTDGAKYSGQYRRGKRHGQGTLIYKNGYKYAGDWRNGKRHGQGTFTFANGAKYVGQFRGGKPNGQGTFTSANGNKYVGEYRDSTSHGLGTYTFADGAKYVGEFKRGKPNGQGTFIFTNGNKYAGQYRDGKRHGQGTFTFANGAKYVGQFSRGKPNGPGAIIAASGKRVEGEWHNGKWRTKEKGRDNKRIGKINPGPGQIQKPKRNQGRAQIPQCLIGQNASYYDCFGSHTYDVDTEFSGDKYVGIFKDDKPHGQGTYTHADGSKYFGQFKDGQFHGEGILYNPDNTISKEGIWENGVFKQQKKISKRRRISKNPELPNRKPRNKLSPFKNAVLVAAGTGFSVTESGHILTNNHVISKCDAVVYRIKGDQKRLKILAQDVDNDLALLKSKFRSNSAFAISQSNAKIMDDIWVIGFPLSQYTSESVKITKGIVSSLKGYGNKHTLFQIDAAVQPGNSGGPIINEKGNVVGVAVSTLNKLNFMKEKGIIPENTNFGIKSSIAYSFLQSNEVALPTPGEENLDKIKMRELIKQGAHLIKCFKTTK